MRWMALDGETQDSGRSTRNQMGLRFNLYRFGMNESISDRLENGDHRNKLALAASCGGKYFRVFTGV